GLLLADDGKVPLAADLEHLVFLPLAVLPRPDPARELAEIDLRIEVGGEVAAMAAGIDVDYVDRIDPVEILVPGKARVGVHHAWIEPGAQDRRDAGGLALGPALPLVVRIPGRRLADLERILVDRRVDIGGTRRDAGRQHGHVHEGRADID